MMLKVAKKNIDGIRKIMGSDNFDFVSRKLLELHSDYDFRNLVVIDGKNDEVKKTYGEVCLDLSSFLDKGVIKLNENLESESFSLDFGFKGANEYYGIVDVDGWSLVFGTMNDSLMAFLYRGEKNDIISKFLQYGYDVNCPTACFKSISDSADYLICQDYARKTFSVSESLVQVLDWSKKLGMNTAFGDVRTKGTSRSIRKRIFGLKSQKK